MDYKKMTAYFETLPSGEKLLDGNGDYWLKLADAPDEHFTGMVADLFTGRIVHFSALGKLTAVYGSEIRW